MPVAVTNAILFFATVILWGSAAIVTGHQAMSANPAVSVAYRMLLVSIVMFSWCLARRTPLFVAGPDRGWIALQEFSFSDFPSSHSIRPQPISPVGSRR